MLRLALGAILSFSAWPLRAWSVIGAVSALLAALYLVEVVIQTLVTGRDVPGYATTVVLLLGLGGLQLMSIGILGEYVARIYDASKQRPRYIIAARSGESSRPGE
jgi:Na+/H+ antiporter NhaC